MLRIEVAIGAEARHPMTKRRQRMRHCSVKRLLTPGTVHDQYSVEALHVTGPSP